MTIAIDKLDKIGLEGVRSELIARHIDENAAEKILAAISANSLADIQAQLSGSAEGTTGCHEMEQVFAFVNQDSLHNSCSFDVQLARGLDYYTGCILEVEALDADMGSLGGGGRYDDLTGVFGMSGLPGVGISFGAERIFDVMCAQEMFPDDLGLTPRILFVSFDDKALSYAFGVATTLRNQGISTDVYPEPAKMKKQMKYADSLGVPFVGIVGEQEIKQGGVMLKNMITGEQSLVPVADLPQKI
jgi:histidyl-tRNA synthetase